MQLRLAGPSARERILALSVNAVSTTSRLRIVADETGHSPLLAISLVVRASDAADRDTGRQRAPPRFVRRIRSTASSREFVSDRASRRQASRSRSDFPLGPA